ncbi:hypothetical protein [Amycolatopsis taiwanensis]|uniref:hypothetical protein n=1 Tax=Amycolatopsis taiwanensis TaxID=342230 RepID=UPI00048753CD|nr:hypothetical protein [Amycolatopsis taiwanensis]
MAEQRPGEQPDQPGREVARAQPSQPELDAEQLRQFRQFQQFQDFLRFSEAQGQDGEHKQPATGGQLVPNQGAPPAPPPGGSLQVAAPRHLPAPRPKIRAPRWAKRLAGKLLSAFLFFLVLAIAGKLAYDHFFPSNDDNRPASETGGGTYHANKILSTQPYEAVRKVYAQIAQDRPDLACGYFDIPIQQKFATDLGYADCEQAVHGLRAEVKNLNEYAESIPSNVSDQQGDTVRIDSCSFSISGGPALGVFTVTKVEKSQWLITGHEPGPPTCAGTSAKTIPTTP